MPSIPDSFLDELVSKSDIFDVVSGYVRLTKRTGSNIFGLCPFHGEKTPSFSVNTDKQIYYCFSCQKGGGVINFIMEIENISFRDAVEILTKRAGMTLPENDIDKEIVEKRHRMLELNRDAARHFHELLASSISESACEYLVKRGISKSMIKRFGIGVTLDSWNNLIDAMMSKGYKLNELIDAGLANKHKAKPDQSNNEAYDVFRNRLMFPVIDVRGNVLGFSGRVFDGGDPKYLNTHDTLVYSKKRTLFGLNFAKKSKSGMLILVEGIFDVIALHQAEFDYAISTPVRTVLTEDQARLISRYANETIIAYNSDEEGHKATLRATALLEKAGVNVKSINIGDSKSSEEYLKKHGTEALKELLE